MRAQAESVKPVNPGAPGQSLVRAAGLLLLMALAACSSQPTDPAEPPVLDPIGGKSVMEGDLLVFGVSAQGQGQSWPALSTSSLPTGADFTDHLDGTGTFEWTPSASQAGNYPVVFRAQSDGLSDSEIVLIVVTSVPPAPPRDTIMITTDTVTAGGIAEVDLVLINPDSSVAGLNIWLATPPDILYGRSASAVS